MKFSVICLFLLSSSEALKLQRHKRPHKHENEKEGSGDIYKDDQGERSTDKMSEFDKLSEDEHHRGDGVTNKLNDDMNRTTKNLPNHEKWVGPKKNPKHVGNFDHKKALVTSESPSGIDLVHLTVDTEEHGRRLAKRLFSKALIA